MIPLGSKAGRGDTRHAVKLATYRHGNLPPGKETAKGIPQFIFFFFSVFLIVAILMAMRRYLSVVFIGISLMIGDVEHLFMCVLAIRISFLERCLFKPFAHF